MGLREYSLDGKVALVTGGAMGIGKACAACLIEAGADVAVADVNAEALGAAVEELSAIREGARIIGLEADMANADQVFEMVSSCASMLGRLDILVNNAGIFPYREIRELDEAFVERVFRINAFGPMLATSNAAEKMIAQGDGGVVINVVSRDAFQPLVSGLATYGATKGALVSFTRHSAMEYAPFGIRVVAIAPGGAITDGAEVNFLDMKPEAQAAFSERAGTRFLLGGPAEARELGTVVAFLASKAASQITGSTVLADGGMLLL